MTSQEAVLYSQSARLSYGSMYEKRSAFNVVRKVALYYVVQVDDDTVACSKRHNIVMTHVAGD